MFKPKLMLTSVVAMAVLATACGSWGSPVTEDGAWAVWSPDSEVSRASFLTDSMAFDIHFLDYRRISYENPEPLPPDLADDLQSSLFLLSEFEDAELVWVGFRLQCGSVVRVELVEFNPPKEMAADGSFDLDLDYLQWTSQFSGSEGWSGDWTSDECGGSWNVTGEQDDDGGVFV